MKRMINERETVETTNVIFEKTSETKKEKDR